MIKPDQLADGSGPRTQQFSVQQIGNTATAASLGVASASVEVLSPMVVRAKSKLNRAWALFMSTLVTGGATYDIQVLRYPKGCGVAKGATTLIPVLTSPGIRLDASNVVGVVEEQVAPFAETVSIQTLQAPGGANQVKLSAGDTRPDGFYCDADIEIISGLGVGQKNRLTSFANGTKIAAVKNLEGTPNWKVATDATSVARITTRRFSFDKGDVIDFAATYTANGGGVGTNGAAGLELEFDDDVTV